jgi:hypothetical protein
LSSLVAPCHSTPEKTEDTLMPTSPRAKQCVRLVATIGVILVVALLYKHVLSPPTLPQQDRKEAPSALDLSSSATSPIVPSSTTTTVSGVTVQVDPRTGKLLPPTNQQKQALAAAFRQQFSQPSPQAAFAHGNGMLSIVVGQSQLNFSLAHTNPKGEIEVSCLTGTEETARLLEDGIPPPPINYLLEKE